MRECKICLCNIHENFWRHEDSYEHKYFLKKGIVDRYVEKNINVDRLKDIRYERIKDHVKIFTDFTIIFCWKVNNIEYSITIKKEQVPVSVSGQESLDRIIKRMLKQINFDIFEESTFMSVSNIKKITHIYYINQPMPMVQRIMSRRFSEQNRNYQYQWLPVCVLYPKFNHISRFSGPHNEGIRSHYLELPTM